MKHKSTIEKGFQGEGYNPNTEKEITKAFLFKYRDKVLPPTVPWAKGIPQIYQIFEEAIEYYGEDNVSFNIVPRKIYSEFYYICDKVYREDSRESEKQLLRDIKEGLRDISEHEAAYKEYLEKPNQIGEWNIQLVIKYPEVEMTNNQGFVHTIKDLFVSWPIEFQKINQRAFLVALEGLRTTFTPKEAVQSYVHSHLPNRVPNNQESSSFCTGDITFFSENASILFSDDAFERKMSLLRGFCLLDSLVSYESLEGGPYAYMKELYRSNTTRDPLQNRVVEHIGENITRCPLPIPHFRFIYSNIVTRGNTVEILFNENFIKDLKLAYLKMGRNSYMSLSWLSDIFCIPIKDPKDYFTSSIVDYYDEDEEEEYYQEDLAVDAISLKSLGDAEMNYNPLMQVPEDKLDLYRELSDEIEAEGIYFKGQVVPFNILPIEEVDTMETLMRVDVNELRIIPGIAETFHKIINLKIQSEYAKK